MIRSFTYFISIDRPSLTEMKTMTSVPYEGRGGTGNNGGTNSHTFANDGGTSSLGHHPTSVFASSVHSARLLQTCLHIHLLFHSSLITLADTTTLPQKMKKE